MVSSRESAVKLRGVAKRYSDIIAVDHIDLDVEYGEIFGLLGPNGSGKTTTLKMILGLVKPDSGSINVLGTNAEENPVEVKAGRVCSRVTSPIRVFNGYRIPRFRR
jgi:ABC-2 type transport system ATP-binding protein